MPKYLTRANLTPDGVKGTLKEGGTARRAAIERLAESLGMRLEAFYYGFGEDDVYAIIDAPDNVAAAASAMAVNAAGTSHVKTVVLITPEEMDEVSKRRAEYAPPGG
ncbi:MAG: GYD domain protein [Candidatus Nephthysia bennettiae]|uniref:GYD domain-containing protein n=1 Tax=Candidatus Nephthysia bennettiae TaxID=3127016 RepID=A0A934N780_9BACT|nr:GYD domain-containing protein [Candidatus Dormibacteraeota bacterium]MBJ7613897.1 GYD domain-containing protein [Candidatus Dormibacteraeota bacterium]PZR97983.1 MAG: GYD domain protein [Candidatus Dormibacteraeota bacterium]